MLCQHPCLLRSCTTAAPAGEKHSHQLSNVTSGPVLKVLPGDARRPHTGPRRGTQKQVPSPEGSTGERRQEGLRPPTGSPVQPWRQVRAGPGGTLPAPRGAPATPPRALPTGAPGAKCGEPCSQREKYRVGRLLGHSTSAKALPGCFGPELILFLLQMLTVFFCRLLCRLSQGRNPKGRTQAWAPAACRSSGPALGRPRPLCTDFAVGLLRRNWMRFSSAMFCDPRAWLCDQ